MADNLPQDPAPAPTPQPAPADPAPAPVDPAPAPAPAPADPAPAPAAPAPVAGDWPGDWREKIAGQDEKLAKRLARYASPNAVVEALVAAQAKISAGVKEPLKADATPEEVAAWRKDNGIPDDPTGYKLDLGEGRVIGELDKPLVDGFLARMHAQNASPTLVNEALAWYYSEQDKFAEEQVKFDSENRSKAVAALKQEWGGDYDTNVQIALNYLPEDIRDVFLAGRMADGSLVGDNPKVLRWLAGQGRLLDPTATVVPGTGMAAMQSIDNELAELTKLSGDHSSEYWKGPKASQLQARMLELLRAKERAGKRA